MPAGKGVPDQEALDALARLSARLELTLNELDDLLHAPQLPSRFAGAAATIDLFERFREWQQVFPAEALTPAVTGVEITQAIQ